VGSYIGLKASVREADLRGSFNQIFLPTEPVLVCAYEVTVGQTVGMMSVCVPAGAVEAILPNLSAGRTVGTTSRQTPAVVDALRESLDEVQVECSAILGRATLTMGDVVNLREGDIIRLDTGPESEVEFWVGEAQACLAIPGRSGRKLGLRVTKVINNLRKAA